MAEPTVTVAGRTYTAAPGLDGLLTTLGVLQPGQHAYLPVAEPESGPPTPVPSPVDDDLRERIAVAIAEYDPRMVGFERGLADVALSVVSPRLAKRSTVAVWDPPWVCDCPGQDTDPGRAHNAGCGGIARTVEHRQEWMTRAVERRQSHARVVTELDLLRWLHAEACWQRDQARGRTSPTQAEIESIDLNGAAALADWLHQHTNCDEPLDAECCVTCWDFATRWTVEISRETDGEVEIYAPDPAPVPKPRTDPAATPSTEDR